MAEQGPHDWICQSGPANWYRLWSPPEWTTREDDEQLTLSPADGSAVLTVCSAWSREAAARALDDLIPLTRFLGPVTEVKSAGPVPSEEDSVGFQGLTRLDAPPAWWKRPFVRKERVPWRLWAIRRGPVVVVATLVHLGERDPELEAKVGYILRTLDFHPHPADPPEVFAERVIELARRKFPLVNSEPGDDFQLRLGQSQINLFNFYRSYVQSPEKFEQLMLPVLTTVVQVQEWGEDQAEPPLERVRDRIMPMLYPEPVWREQFPSFVGNPWVGGLMILYVVDEAQAYWYIRDTLPDAWGISEEQLHEIALANLDEYFERKPMQLAVTGGGEHPLMVMPAQPDSYNAVRVLSESFRRRVREVVGGAFAVGIPNRDFFIVVGLESEELLQQIREKVRGNHVEMDHPLTEGLLLVTPDGVSEFPGDEA